MVIFYLTNMTLDVTMGVAWWVAKTTLIGIYNGSKYLIYGPEDIIKDDLGGDTDIILEELKQLKKEIQQLKKDE